MTRASHEPASVGRRFRDALTADGFSIIAEIKRRSPSRGALRIDADAASLARAYQDAGAACLSVLTDEKRFGGSPRDLREARSAVSIPILRKDFLRTEQDVYETYEMGADALLLIVTDVDVEMLRPLHDLARELNIDVLTEVRDEDQLKLAVKHGADIIAVNQRDNPRAPEFTVDYNKAVRVSAEFHQLDDGIVKVAASGVKVEGGTPIEDVVAAGYDAALIGEALVTAADPRATLSDLVRRAAHKERVPVG